MTRPFKGFRTDAIEMATALRPLVEHSDIIEDIRLGQIPGFIIAFSDSFFFQRTKE
ncbi:hypothetical protein TUM17569_62340 [Klebsiella oxytoca]|jgi:hypothetical protein|nr:hypothetical protein TUM17569_62340 [Klebsiella oxytoca]